jgi:hypothetical protein
MLIVGMLSSHAGTLPDSYLNGVVTGHAAVLKLGGNRLHGPLPAVWGSSNRTFQELDLSSNAFSGRFDGVLIEN